MKKNTGSLERKKNAGVSFVGYLRNAEQSQWKSSHNANYAYQLYPSVIIYVYKQVSTSSSIQWNLLYTLLCPLLSVEECVQGRRKKREYISYQYSVIQGWYWAWSAVWNSCCSLNPFWCSFLYLPFFVNIFLLVNNIYIFFFFSLSIILSIYFVIKGFASNILLQSICWSNIFTIFHVFRK